MTLPDNTEESIIKDQKYLTLTLNNDYSVSSLTPGQGRYSYDNNSVAEIKFELNDGYDFESWDGNAKSRLSSADGANSYQIKMTEDSQLTLKTILNDFKLLKFNLGDVREVDYSSGKDIGELPYNLEELILTFNNKVNENNELQFEINNQKSSETIINSNSEYFSNDILTIEENKIIINWEYFNPAEEEDLNFGIDYQLIVSEGGLENNDNIFDPELNELNNEVKINFTMEEAKPEKVENLVLSTEDDKLELSWLRSEQNKNYQNESYVSKYKIYKFKNVSEFTKDNALEEILVKEENPDDNKIVRKKITGFTDLENNTYNFRVTAVNNVDNESELSEIVSTD